MGQEIDQGRFDPGAFERFAALVATETDTLAGWCREELLSPRAWMAGFELESWLVGPDALPRPMNEAFLEALGNDLVVPELARFNVEINGSPTKLQGRAFSRLADELQHTWDRCQDVAHDLGAHLLMIGIPPTLDPEALHPGNMSSLTRFAALNEQLIEMRHGRPFELRIDGRERIRRTHPDVMLEAAATSFQIHLQVRQRDAARLYNAAVAVSGPMVAVSANSPYLFGHDLWDETRIPLFEQAVAAGSREYQRVSFGRGYCRESLFELFEENRDHHPVLIPALQEGGSGTLAHLRFHNGTIWRWNRPLIGYDHDGLPHFRIEHRVVPAGPTVADAIANAAFFYGLMAALGRRPVAIERELSFADARTNFYESARYGLDASVHWPGGGGRGPVRTLILDVLLPEAARGLAWLGIPDAEAGEQLGVIEARLRADQTGARWQRRWTEHHGRHLGELTLAYLEHQQSGIPVHRWPI